MSMWKRPQGSCCMTLGANAVYSYKVSFLRLKKTLTVYRQRNITTDFPERLRKDIQAMFKKEAIITRIRDRLV